MYVTNEFDKTKFKVAIKPFPHQIKALVGASACQRLVECYGLFNHRTSFGDYELIKGALSKIWVALEKGELASFNASELIESCEKQTPDSDDFGDMLSTFAQNSIFSICSLLDFLSEGADEEIAQAVSFVVDTVDYLAQEVEQLNSADPELETKILNSGIMQQELSNQILELEKISSSNNVQELYFDFRRRSKELGENYLKIVKDLI